MKFRTSTLDLIAKEYAEAMASGEFERAEGWFATARLAASREADRSQAPDRSSVGHVGRRSLLPH
jgi:hypothetical protein